MRRVMLLALLAAGLPTAALASTFDFSTGAFVSGTFSGSFTTMINVSVNGSLNEITIDTGTLSSLAMCPVPGATCFTFTTGSVTVKQGGTTLFEATLDGGFVSRMGNAASLNALLLPDSQISAGSASFNILLSDSHIIGGSAGVVGEIIPEPGTLGLLGTGLIGLAGMARKLNL